MGYIKVPIETNVDTLAANIYAYIQANSPGWTPADGNLDVWIIKAVAALAAENRDLASDVPDTIYADFGNSILGIAPLDALSATGNTTWTLLDTLGHTIPAGTSLGIRDANGDIKVFQTVADVIVAPGDSVTASGEVAITAIDAGTDSNALTATPQLIDVLDWVLSIALSAPTSGGVDAETNQTYLDRLTRHTQRLSTVPILPGDFALAAMDADPSVYRAVALDQYNPFHNLLSANDASFETGVAGYTGTNAVLAQSATEAADGTDSMSLTASSAADMYASLIQADEVVVVPGQVYTAIASFRADTTGRVCKVGIAWYTSGNALIGATVFGTTVNDTNAAFTPAFVTAIAPATAAFARIVTFVTAPANTEIHYVDKNSIRHGSTTDWVAGGTPETGNIRTMTVAAVDIDGDAVSGGVKTIIQNFINSRREQNWITHVMDPNYTEVDITSSVSVLTGFDPSTVQSSVDTALSNYLDKKNWATDPTVLGSDQPQTWIDSEAVYYNEVIALISNVAGVDRVVTLTMGVHGGALSASDITLDEPASLTTPGTITITTV